MFAQLIKQHEEVNGYEAIQAYKKLKEDEGIKDGAESRVAKKSIFPIDQD